MTDKDKVTARAVIDKDNGYNPDAFMDAEQVINWQVTEIEPMFRYTGILELIASEAEYYPNGGPIAQALAQCLPVERRALPAYFDVDVCDKLTLDALRVLTAGLRVLDRYADMKYTAMITRKAEDINGAMECENACDILYKELPESLRSW